MERPSRPIRVPLCPVAFKSWSATWQCPLQTRREAAPQWAAPGWPHCSQKKNLSHLSGWVGRKFSPSHLFSRQVGRISPVLRWHLHLAPTPAPATSFGSCRRRIVVTLVSTALVPTANHPRPGRLPFRVCEPMHFGGPPHLPSHHFETRWDVPRFPPLNWDVLSGTGL